MNIKNLAQDFSVSEQISTYDVADIARAGYKTIICNRPDGEDEQHLLAALTIAAKAFGIQVAYVPVVHDSISSVDVEAFTNAWHKAERPVLAYCRSGLRSSTLWALMQISNGAQLETAIASATAAGYDFSSFRSKFAPLLAEITAGNQPNIHPLTSA
jgi:sulfide:quinone oxidoreductase